MSDLSTWLDLLAKGDVMIGFHGSCQRLDRFCESKVGQGGDPNSVLGVFLTELVDSAIEYALYDKGDEGYVHVVIAPSKKSLIIESHSDFFGYDMPSEEARAHFINLRERLIREGYDHILLDGFEDPISVALHPQQTKIIARLTPEEAEPLEALEMEGPLILQYLQRRGLLLEGKSHKKAFDFSPSPW